MVARCLRSTVSAPATGVAPPHTPVPAPKGTSATRLAAHQRSTATTSSRVRGATTASGTGSSSPARRRISIRGHQSWA
jgi:hypothetical protein